MSNRNDTPGEHINQFEGADLSDTSKRAATMVGGRNPSTNKAEQLTLFDGAMMASIGTAVDGPAIYSASRGDFDADAGAGTKDITLSSLVGNLSALSKIMIVAITIDGVPAPIINATVAGFVIAVADWPANFAGTEVVDVILIGLPRAYDNLTDAIKTSMATVPLGLRQATATVAGPTYDPGDDLEHTIFTDNVSGQDVWIGSFDLDDDASYAVVGDEEFRIFLELVDGEQIEPRYVAAAGNPKGIDWNGPLTSSTAGVFIVAAEGSGGDMHMVVVPLMSSVKNLSITCKVANGMSLTIKRSMGKG